MSHGPAGQEPFRFSRDLARLGIAAVLLGIALLGSAAARLFHEAEASIESHRLRSVTRVDIEMDGLRARMDTLGGAIRSVARNASTLRLTDAAVAPASVQPAAAGIEVEDLLRRARVLAFGWRAAGDALRKEQDERAGTPSILPTSGYISSVFNMRRFHPILGKERPHVGIDIVAPFGTPVVAAALGRVTFVGRRGQYGLMIVLDHGRGRVTRYAHLSRANVHLGQRVERGEAIGRVGASGLAEGAHLHYEVLINGRFTNPRRYIVESHTTAN